MIRTPAFAGFVFLLLLLSAGHACAGDDVNPPAPRIGVSAGMGVSYLVQRDLVDMINGAYSQGSRVDDFHAAVDFFGSVAVPLSAYWAVRAEYAYLLNTYNVSALLGPGEFTTVVHMPSIIVEYILIQETFYNLSGGIGGGYHFGSLDLNYGSIRDSYTARGPGMVAMLNGNTAMGEDLFVHLAVNARWELLGELRDSNDRSPGVGSTGSPASLGSFGVGARLGVTYYF